MEVLKIGDPHTVTCQKCGSVLKYGKDDIHWSHTEEDCYYIICPICKGVVWIDGTEELDEWYKEKWQQN